MLLKSILLSLLIFTSSLISQGQAQECSLDEIKIATTPIFPQRPVNYRSFAQKDWDFSPKTEVVFLGDSITNRFPDGLIKGLVGSSSFSNLGIEGDTTQNILWRLENSRMKEAHPKTVVLMIGVNNLLDGAAPCAVIAATKKIIVDLQTMWPGASIIQIGILPNGPNFQRRDADRLSINSAIDKFGETLTKYHFLEIGDGLTCGQRTPPTGIASFIPKWLYDPHCAYWEEDNLHLVAPGYALLAASISPYFNK